MAEHAVKTEKYIQAKPILKWAGGKRQLLGDIMPKVPDIYGKYIEPFIGGGALFFALNPKQAVIADSNPELINMYQQVADSVDGVITYLRKYKNTKEDFYAVRGLHWTRLPKEEAAARTIYLNKTCFNGQFYKEDHIELAKEVKRLQELGCHIILTNSNHPLVHELYKEYKYRDNSDEKIYFL